MTLGTIVCHTEQQLARLCAALVREGVTFEARMDSLTITLTGGY